MQNEHANLTKLLSAVIFNIPQHHVVGKVSSFSAKKRLDAIKAFSSREPPAGETDISAIDFGVSYEDALQAMLEVELLRGSGQGENSDLFYVSRCNGLEIVHSPAIRSVDMGQQTLEQLVDFILGENVLGMMCRLLETHSVTSRVAMCYVGYVEHEGGVDFAVDGGTNRWPMDLAYHAVRMRPILDGKSHRVRHADMLALYDADLDGLTKRLFSLAIKLADDFARMDVPALEDHQLQLNYMNYFYGYAGLLAGVARALILSPDEHDRQLRMNCLEGGSYIYTSRNGVKRLRYEGHSKYARWATDFIASTAEYPALNLSYIDNLHSIIKMCAALWTTDEGRRIGEALRALFAMMQTRNLASSDEQEWYLHLEDADHVKRLLHQHEWHKDLDEQEYLQILQERASGDLSAQIALKLYHLYQLTSGFATPLPLTFAEQSFTHRASWLGSIPEVTGTEQEHIFKLLRPGPGWTIDNDDSDQIRTTDARGIIGDLRVVNGGFMYIPRTNTATQVAQTFRLVDEITLHGVGIRCEPAVISAASSSSDVIQATLAGGLGVGASLWLLKQMFRGNVAVSARSDSSVTAVCPLPMNDAGAVVSSLLCKEAAAAMAVVSDGHKLYTALSETNRCVSIERNMYGRYCWRAVPLPDINTLRRGLLKYPALVGDQPPE